MVKTPPARQETQVQSLGQEDILGKEMATHSGIIAWEIPQMEKPGEPQSMWLQRVRHDSVTKQKQKDESLMGCFNKRRDIKEKEESKKYKITSYTNLYPQKSHYPCLFPINKEP